MKGTTKVSTPNSAIAGRSRCPKHGRQVHASTARLANTRHVRRRHAAKYNNSLARRADLQARADANGVSPAAQQAADFAVVKKLRGPSSVYYVTSGMSVRNHKLAPQQPSILDW